MNAPTSFQRPRSAQPFAESKQNTKAHEETLTESKHTFLSFQMSRSKAILALLPRSQPLSVTVASLNNKAVSFYERGWYQEANTFLGRALKLVKDECTAQTKDFSRTCSPMRLDDLAVIFEPATQEESKSAGEGFKYQPEYEEGMDYYKKPFLLNDFTKSMEGTILFNLGRVCHNQDNSEEAMDLYRRSLGAIQRWQGHDYALTLAVVFSVAHIQYVQRQLSCASRTYSKALSLAKSSFGEESLEVAACMTCLGVVHHNMSLGPDNAALEYFQTSLKYRVKLLGNDHLDVGTTLNNTGRLLFHYERYDEALEAYREALRIRRLHGDDSIDVAATIYNMGQVLHQLGNRPKALCCYREFLNRATKILGSCHRDVSVATTSIGQVLLEEKKYDKALQTFQLALQTFQLSLGDQHPETAVTLNRLGNLYYETGDLESALKSYRRGLAVELAVLDTGDPSIHVTYSNIAEIYRQKSDFGKALKYYEKVLHLQRRHKCDPIDTACTLASIGYLLQAQGNYAGALDALQESLCLQRQAKGDNDEDVASTMIHVALTLVHLNKFDTALEVFAEAYRIRQNQPKPNPGDIAYTLYNIAFSYEHQGMYDEALKYYLETSRVEKEVLGTSHRDLSITLYNIARLYYQRGDLELAMDTFGETLEIERKCFGKTDPNCARTLNEIGNIAMQLGMIEAVMECFSEALRIYRNANLGENRLKIFGRKLWRFHVVHPKAAATA